VPAAIPLLSDASAENVQSIRGPQATSGIVDRDTVSLRVFLPTADDAAVRALFQRVEDRASVYRIMN
jgi:hypothetical protein